MALKITGKNQNKTFVPIAINLTIEINTKEDLKKLKNEFKIANLEDYNIIDGDDNEELPVLTEILQAVEKELD